MTPRSRSGGASWRQVALYSGLALVASASSYVALSAANLFVPAFYASRN